MQVKASLKHLSISPRKVRVVINELRGLNALKAIDKLSFLNKRVSGPLIKLIKSAVANAEHNYSLETEPLVIKDIKVDGGPILKRFRAKGFGRSSPIQHKTSHVTVVLEGDRLKQIKEAEQAKTSKKEEVKETVNVETGVDVKQEEIDKPATADKPVTKEAPEKEAVGAQDSKRAYEVEKKVGREQKQSFVKRLFRRKSV